MSSGEFEVHCWDAYQPVNRLADGVTVNLGYHLSQHTTKERDSKPTAGVRIFCEVKNQDKGRFEVWIGEQWWGILSHQGDYTLFTQRKVSQRYKELQKTATEVWGYGIGFSTRITFFLLIWQKTVFIFAPCTLFTPKLVSICKFKNAGKPNKKIGCWLLFTLSVRDVTIVLEAVW